MPPLRGMAILLLVAAAALSGCIHTVPLDDGTPPADPPQQAAPSPAPQPVTPAPLPPAPSVPDPELPTPEEPEAEPPAEEPPVDLPEADPTHLVGADLGPQATLARNVSWTFEGHPWWYTMSFTPSAYDAYRDRPRASLVVNDDGTLYKQAAFDVYVTEPQDDPVMMDMADRFWDVARREGWDDRTTVSFVLAFVQALPYTSDNVTAGFDEYPRYPIETLVDEGGDCEDTSILLAAILDAMGFDVVLLSPPGHMGTGVRLDALPGDGAYGGYLYAETTGDGWAVGEVPDDYLAEPMQVWSLEPRAVLALDTEVVGAIGGQAFHITVTNLGTVATEDARVGVMREVDGTVDWSRQCTWPVVERLQSVTCDVALDLSGIPKGAHVALVVQAAVGTTLHQEVRYMAN